MRSQSARLRNARHSAEWYSLWLRRISAHYAAPLYQIERMPLGAFHREIATLLAGVIVDEAARLMARTSDLKERRRRDAEYKKLTASKDWIDRMIVERIKQDSKK